MLNVNMAKHEDFRIFIIIPHENFFLLWRRQSSTPICFEAVESTKISSNETVLSQKYEICTGRKFET